jgi:chromate transport protein ChrA
MIDSLLEAVIKMLWMIGPSIILAVGLSWTINKILPSGIPILPNWFMYVGTSFLKMVHGAANMGEIKLATGTSILVSAMLTGIFWRNLLFPATIIAGFITLFLSFLQDTDLR